MSRVNNKAFAYTARILILSACGFFSIFLIMSGYESVYNRALPFVDTLAEVDLAAFNKNYNLTTQSYQIKSLYGDFGRPQTLKLPARSLTLSIVPPIEQATNSWLARANTMHLFLPAKTRQANIGIAFLYCRAGFRTINTDNIPKTGSNIILDTDRDWRYVYKVTATRILNVNVQYIAADDGSNSKLIIDCNDKKLKQNIIIEATLLSVQGTNQ